MTAIPPYVADTIARAVLALVTPAVGLLLVVLLWQTRHVWSAQGTPPPPVDHTARAMAMVEIRTAAGGERRAVRANRSCSKGRVVLAHGRWGARTNSIQPPDEEAAMAHEGAREERDEDTTDQTAQAQADGDPAGDQPPADETPKDGE